MLQALSRARFIATSATLFLASGILTEEVSKLVADVSINGRTYSPSALYAFNQIGQASTALDAWGQAVRNDIAVDTWLVVVLLIDIGFMVGYAGLLLGLGQRWQLGLRNWVIALLIADALENGLSLAAVCALPDKCWVTKLLPAVTTLKWAIVACVLGKALYRFVKSDANKQRARDAWTILKLQRLVLLFLVVFAVMLIVPTGDVLQQGVDIERSWIFTDDRGRGIGYIITGFAAVVGFAAVLRFLSSVVVARLAPAQQPLAASTSAIALKLRTWRDAFASWLETKAQAMAPTPDSSWLKRRLRGGMEFLAAFVRSLVWVLAAGLVLLLGAVLDWTGAAHVYFGPLLSIAGVLIAVALAGAALRKVDAAPDVAAGQLALRPSAWKAGRLLAWSVVTVLLISLSRAYFPLMLIGEDRVVAGVVALLSLAAACAFVFFLLSTGKDPKFYGGPDGRPVPDTQLRFVHPQLVGVRQLPGAEPVPSTAQSIMVVLGPALVCLVALLIMPAWIARGLGAIGVMGACLGTMALVFAVFTIASQLIDAPHVFRVAHIRQTPVIGMVLVMGLVATFAGRGTDLHDVRRPDAKKTLATAGQDGYDALGRPSLETAYTSWINAGPCSLELPERVQGHQVRITPLLFVAAEGGGIRAAWWTVKSMLAMTENECVRKSVFLASGVSGGAVGLAQLAQAKDASKELDNLAGQDAVSEALAGLLSRDLFAGIAGLNMHVIDADDDRHEQAYPDRGTLIEQEWDRESAGLAATFPNEPTASAPWYTVFNGTSALRGCRVIVSNVDFGSGDVNCQAPGSPTPGAYDLLDKYPCYAGMAASTASLLAARFPYVTPSGVLRDCETGALADQIIDGGYSENSGIDTVDDALLRVLPVVRAQNAIALNATDEINVVVPMVVFLHNTPVASVGAANPKPPKPRAEVLLPPSLKNSAKDVLGDTTTLVARSNAIAAAWVNGTDGIAAAVVDAVNRPGFLPDRTIIVAPQQKPQVAPPLGWTLSSATRTTLDDALADYIQCDDDADPCPAAARELALLLDRMSPN